MAVTYGTEHRFVHGRLLPRVLAPILPASWRKRAGVTVAEFRSETPTLMVWVQWRGRPPDPRDITDASVFDLEGIEGEPVRGKSTFYIFDQPWGAVRGWQFANFPRRGKHLGVRLYARGAAYNPDPLAEFTFPNPAPRRLPVWDAPALPQTQRMGQWEFTLTRFTTGEIIPERLKPQRGWTAPWTSAAFEVRHNGRPSQEWTVAGIQATDASGNVANFTSVAITNPGAGPVFGFNAALWKAEPAWKLRVEFSRAAGFREDELVSVQGVAVPPLGGATKVDQTFPLQGASLNVRALERPWGMAGFIGSIQPNAVLTCLLVPPEGVRLRLVRVRDEQGREGRFLVEPPPASGYYSFRLEVPRQARALDFTLAVSPSVYVEFVARPDFVGNP